MSGFHVAGFVLRTPLLPITDLLALGDDLVGVHADAADLDAALRHDRDRVRERLRSVIDRPDVRDALYVAAPTFDAALEQWLEGSRLERREKVEASLFRYLARMAGRPTPFGLCAGCSTGRIGPARLELGAPSADAPHSRLDMDLLFAVVEWAAADPAAREQLTYRPNPALYRAGGRLRYIEAVSERGRRACRLVAADADAELQATLERAGRGATRAELAAPLAVGDTSSVEALAYLDELIDAQLLVPDIALPVIGPEPTLPLARRLRELPGVALTAELVERAADELEAADRAPAGQRRVRLNRLARQLAELPVAADPARTFQVDLIRAMPDAALPLPVLSALRHGIEILRRFPPRPHPAELQRLRDRFAERYGDRAVPLGEALDPEIGVGLDAAEEDDGRPLADDRDAPSVPPEIERLLLRMAGEAAARGVREVELGRRELTVLDEQPAQPLPGAFAVLAALAADSDAALDRGEFDVRLMSVSGPSGARMLGRFCHADPHLAALVETHLRREEAHRPDAVFAEIAHLPEGRTGNVLARPRLREHEIVLLSGSSAPDDRRLLIDDLTVALRDGSFVLWSRRLDAEVIPRLTTAHNYFAGGVGIYRFLALLQQQEAIQLGWSWGSLAGLPFTPRVRCGRIVLAPARWTAYPGELPEDDGREPAARFAAVQRWRRERGLPRLVGLQGPDAALPVDLDNPLGVDLLLRAARSGGPLALVELWPEPDRLAVRGPGGRYVHELIVPMALPAPRVAEPATARRRPARDRPPPRRTFPPGSEWLYAKLYTGRATADRILVEDVRPVVEAARAQGAATSWHFLRYADPEFHLRIRFRGHPDRLREEVMTLLAQTAGRLIEDGRAWRFGFDTYEREVERYGGSDGIEPVEAAFEADSDAVLALLAADAPGERAARERWRVAVPAALLLARDLMGDPRRALAVIASLRSALIADTSGTDGKPVLARRLRAERPHVERLLDEALAADGDGQPAWLAALERRSRALAPVAAQLAAREHAGRLDRRLEEIAGSLVHMHVNRLLRAAGRPQELAVYDAVQRLSAGRDARARRIGAPAS